MPSRVLLSLLFLGVSPGVWAEAPGAPFERCEALFAAAPEERDSSRCFYSVANGDPSLAAEAGQRLETLLTRDREDPWIRLYLAHVFKNWPQSRAELLRAEFLYHEAAEGFSGEGEVQGEMFARRGLRSYLLLRGRGDEVDEQVQRLVELTRANPSREMEARRYFFRGEHLYSQRRNLGQAYNLLQRAKTVLFSDELVRVTNLRQMRFDTLLHLGHTSLELGQPDNALPLYDSAAEIAREMGNSQGLAAASEGRLHVFVDQYGREPSPQCRTALLDQVRDVLATAAAAEHWEVLLLAHYWLGNLSEGEAARQHFERCGEIAVEHQAPIRISDCLGAVARHLAPLDPGEAHRVKDEALALVSALEDPRAVAYARSQAMQVSWLTGPRERAIADSYQALAAIERLRGLQGGLSGRAGLFSEWVPSYQFVAGHLLRSHEATGLGEDVELAFRVHERMRARVLQEALDRAASPLAPPSAEAEMLAGLRRRLTEINRGLIYGRLTPEEREAAYRELEELEMDEQDLQAEIVRFQLEQTAVEAGEFATLEQIRSELQEDEALLSFQAAPWQDLWGEFGGGSWVFAVTRRGVTVHRLPGGDRLRLAVGTFLGLFEARDGREAGASAHLYRELMAPALAALPSSVRKLILIPDGALHRLPFGALRAAPDQETLAAGYRLTRVPSATLWLRWRENPPPPASLPALVVADPVLAGHAEGRQAEGVRGWHPTRGSELAPLPNARREGWSVRRRLGSETVLLVGQDATEHDLVSRPLDTFGILHFAAHATVDEANPQRSGVHLSAASEQEDGWLQFREIVDLELGGRPVVLSACRSASASRPVPPPPPGPASW